MSEQVLSLTEKPNYGLDAPGVVRLFSLGGAGLIAMGIALAFFGSAAVANDWAPALIWPGFSFLLTSALMAGHSYFGKFRARDALLDTLELRGNETVLDLGCGRGLLLIGAAKRLPAGKALGLDLWSNHDLSSNSKKATLENAALEGVAHRIEVMDGDMRFIPLKDGSVDVITASMSIHNIPTKAGRKAAMLEVARVLRPGGKVALLDFKHTSEYQSALREAGFQNTKRPFSLFCFPPARVVFGEKK